MKKKRNKTLLWILVLFSVSLTLILLLTGSPSMRSRTIAYFMKMTPTVVMATFLGSVFELRNWIRWMHRILKPLVSLGRLPHLSGVTMVMALFSNKSAGAMLSGALSDDEISRASLRTTAMCNSYIAYLSHSLRIAWPTVAAAGSAGFFYFGIQFTTGFLIILVAVLIHRVRFHQEKEIESTVVQKESERSIPGWKETFTRAGMRTIKLMSRLLLISIPSYLIVLHLSAKGVFSLWQKMLPEQMAEYFPAEVLAITVGMLGGIINAATLGGAFIESGELGTLQVVFAMLIGSAMGNPIRTIRRNLPSALGIYHPKDGLFIVGIMQGARFVTVLLVCFSLILIME